MHVTESLGRKKTVIRLHFIMLDKYKKTGALTNDYTELTLHFCLNNNYSFFQNFRVLNSNYTNLDRVE